jgi:hypothetical protein
MHESLALRHSRFVSKNDTINTYRKYAHPFKVSRKLNSLIERKVERFVHDLIWSLLALSCLIIIVSQDFLKFSVLSTHIYCILLLFILITNWIFLLVFYCRCFLFLGLLILLVFPLSFYSLNMFILLGLIVWGLLFWLGLRRWRRGCLHFFDRHMSRLSFS